MNRFEIANAVRARANQLENGALATVPLAGRCLKPVSIAMDELAAGTLEVMYEEAPPPNPNLLPRRRNAESLLCDGE